MKIKTQLPGAACTGAMLMFAALTLTPMLSAQIRDPVAGPGLLEDRAEEKPVLREVPFLGISTHRVDAALASKMKLPQATGLVVGRVLPNSPAEGVLKPQDLLTHLDDQVLVEPRQFGVLVRSRKEGEEVRLTLFRAGKEQVVRVKLGKREMPPLPEQAPPVIEQPKPGP